MTVLGVKELLFYLCCIRENHSVQSLKPSDSTADIWRESFPVRREQQCKALAVEASLTYLKNSKEASDAGAESEKGRVAGDEVRQGKGV